MSRNDSRKSDNLPAPQPNAPDLPRLVYRAGGTHGKTLQRLYDRLAASVRLRDLSERDVRDPTLALLDGWATVAEVLSFYQERIENESYLRTATEDRSLDELARLAGYRVQPGVAAETYLAFTIEQTVDDEVKIEPGVLVQSVPRPGELPQPYETVEPLVARREWNLLKLNCELHLTIRPSEQQPQALYLQGVATGLHPGDPLLVMLRVYPGDGPGSQESTGGSAPEDRFLYRVVEVTPDRRANRTMVMVVPWLERPCPPDDTQPSIVTTKRIVAGAHALRVQAALFGYNAPRKLVFDEERPAPPERWLEWQVEGESGRRLYLDNEYASILPGSYVAIVRPAQSSEEPQAQQAASQAAGEPEAQPTPQRRERCLVLARATAAAVGARTAYGLSGKTTEIELDEIELARGWWKVPSYEKGIVGYLHAHDHARLIKEFAPIRETVVYAASEELKLAPAPNETPVGGSYGELELELDKHYPELPRGRRLVVSGSVKKDKNEPGHLESEVIELASSSRSRTEPDGKTVLTLRKPLAHTYERASVEISGNVTRATHGETRRQVLGSGDGQVPLQRFTLDRWPLTYVGTTDARGAESTLKVYVNDVEWQEREQLQPLRSDERGYMLLGRVDYRPDPLPWELAVVEGAGPPPETEHKTTVVFGSGEHGARLPTGEENIRAIYRVGLGAAGNVGRGQISMLAVRPPGVKSVTNPLPAGGGVDREVAAQIRRNVPLRLTALDRLISPQDYEDFARCFAGVGKARAAWRDPRFRDLIEVTIAGAQNATITYTEALVGRLTDALRSIGDPHQLFEVKIYQPFMLLLRAGVVLERDYTWEPIERAARARLVETFSFDRRGFGQDVAESIVIAAIQGVRGVRYVHLECLHGLRSPETVAASRIEELLEGATAPLAPDSPGWMSIGTDELALLYPDRPETIRLEQIDER